MVIDVYFTKCISGAFLPVYIKHFDEAVMSIILYYCCYT